MFVNITEFLGGIGIFFFALLLLDEAIAKSPEKLKSALNKSLGNEYFECFLGFASSAITQSSTAINGILINLADHDIIKRKSCYFVVMGTNIGTTLTAFIAVLAKINMSQLFIVIPFVCAVLMMVIKKEKIKNILYYVCVVSLIFTGLYIVNRTVPSFLEEFDAIRLKDIDAWGLFALSTAATALCQSSALISVITVTLSGYGMLTFEGAMFMIMGANLGTCATGLWASIGKSKAGVSVAVFNIFLNAAGILLHVFLYYTGLLNWFVKVNVSMDTKTALFHAFFNVVTTLFVFPFVKTLDHVRLGKRIISFYE